MILPKVRVHGDNHMVGYGLAWVVICWIVLGSKDRIGIRVVGTTHMVEYNLGGMESYPPTENLYSLS